VSSSVRSQPGLIPVFYMVIWCVKTKQTGRRSGKPRTWQHTFPEAETNNIDNASNISDIKENNINKKKTTKKIQCGRKNKIWRYVKFRIIA